MANKTIENLREYAVNKWAWARYDYFLLQMKDRWEVDDYMRADELCREIQHAHDMVVFVDADIKKLNTGRIEDIIEYCRNHKRES